MDNGVTVATIIFGAILLGVIVFVFEKASRPRHNDSDDAGIGIDDQ